MHTSAACCFLLFLAVGPALTTSQAAQGSLEGKELTLANEARSGLESVAGSLLGGALNGRLTHVVIDQDQERNLTVRVSYEGFEGANLWGELLNADGRRQLGIAMGDPVTLPDAASDVMLTFRAEPGAAPTPSALLRISVAASQRRTASYVRTYRLGKEWSAPEISGENFSITITPRPIGRTADLGSSPSSAMPSATARVAPTPNAGSAPPAGAQTPSPFMSPSRSAAAAARSMTGARPMSVASKAAMQALPPGRNIKISSSFYGLNTTDANNGALGPAALPVRPFNEVHTEDIGLDLTKVLNVFPEVYQDQHPSSGIFYFLPHAYGLEWNETDGYAFRTIYSAATGGAPGQVMMAARLGAGLDARDLAITAKIVRAYAEAHQMPFAEVRPLPIDTLAISLSDDLGRYSIPADRVSVHGLSDITGALEVSWVTDERTKDFIQEALLENVGISGSVRFAPTGHGLGTRVIPALMQLADESTFGPFRWERTGCKNVTPYPVVLKYLHALRFVGATPVVSSWSLGDARIPSGGQVRWSSSGIPFWLDAQAEKMWIDYAVDRGCRACGTNAIAALTGGVSTAGGAQITFHSLTPLAETGAHDVQLEVRSRYFDPRGEELQVRSIVVDADEKDFLVGPLFLGQRSGAGAEGGSFFEYRVSLTMKDGDVFAGSAAWIPGDALRVPIGRRQLERSLGSLPGR